MEWSCDASSLIPMEGGWGGIGNWKDSAFIRASEHVLSPFLEKLERISNPMRLSSHTLRDWDLALLTNPYSVLKEKEVKLPHEKVNPHLYLSLVLTNALVQDIIL